MVTIGVDLPTSRWAADCADEHGDVYAAVAIHPNDTARAAASAGAREAVLAEIAALAERPRVRAIGETGLDYYRDWAPPEVQREWFRAHIDIAKQSGKALVIHDREAHEDVLRILDDEGRAGAGGLPLLLRRRGDGQAVCRGRVPDELRRQRHVLQRPAAARRGRGGPA